MAHRLDTFLRFLISLRPGWPIFLCVVAWTAVCQYWMIQSHFYDPRADADPHHRGNIESDLLHNIIATGIEFLIFLAMIRPWSYQIMGTASRALGFALVMFVASFYHLFNTMHAGPVNATQLAWSGGMLLGSLALPFLGAGAGLVKRIADGQKRRRGDI